MLDIPAYIFELPQVERVYEFLKYRGKRGVYVFELTAARPYGIGVQQYNARILENRRRGRVIHNKPGFFWIEEPGQEVGTDLVADSENWKEMRAFLRGDGPKPKPNFSSNTELEKNVQEALF